MSQPYLSIVVPIYNEEANLVPLMERLYPVVQGTGLSFEKGHDVVGTIRQQRQDSIFRKSASRIVNITTNKITGMQMRDYGCMLRAYHRYVVDNINRCRESSTFIPALAQTFASNPSEIEVGHAERTLGASKYSFYKLIRLNFDLMTGFSVVPLQLFALCGIITSLLSLAFAIFLLVRRFIFYLVDERQKLTEFL